MKRIFISIILTVGFIPISSYSAGAIYGGSLSIGDTRVVKIWEDESIYNGCSAALLTPQIVISAAHCTDHNTPHEGMAYETSAFIPARQWWASPPGVDGSVVDLSTRVKIVKGYITKGYTNIWPCTSSGCTQQDDIVFYILEKPLVASYSIPIATEADVAKIKQQKMVVTHIGYGYQGDVKSSKNIDGKPYKIPGTAVNEIIRIGNPPKETNKIIRTIQSKMQSLCPGDSGSPVYVNINGVEKNLAVQFAGRGLCTGLEPGELPSSINTLVYPYIDLLRAEPLAASLIAEYDKDVAADKASADKVIADKAAAELKAKQEAETKVVAELKAKQESEAKAAAEFKAKQEAEAKAAAEFKAKQEAEAKAVKLKKTTITCIKGKLLKKVTEVKPVCPKGYKKK